MKDSVALKTIPALAVGLGVLSARAEASAWAGDVRITAPQTLQVSGMHEINSLWLAPGDYTLTGTGELSVTNKPFCVGGASGATIFTVSGAHTSFTMPKQAGSGLYIGRVDGATSSDVFHVTDGAVVDIANATCVGYSYDIDSDQASGCPGGTLLVDGGATFHGGVTILVGRWQSNSAEMRGAVVAITNGTMTATENILAEQTWNTQLGGSNATVMARVIRAQGIGRHGRFDFVDSTLTATQFVGLAVGRYGTGRIQGGR